MLQGISEGKVTDRPTQETALNRLPPSLDFISVRYSDAIEITLTFGDQRIKESFRVRFDPEFVEIRGF